MIDCSKFGLLIPSSLSEEIFYSNFLTKKKLKIYSNVTEYCQSNHKFKIALIDLPFYKLESNKDFEEISLASNFVILHNMELGESDVNIILTKDKKFTFSINGVINHSTDFKTSLEWFSSTSNYYKNNLKFILEKLDPFEEKKYFFDFLPGRIGLHRVAVMNYIKENNLTEKIFCGNFFNGVVCDNYDDNNFWDNDIVKNSLDPKVNIHQVMYHDNLINLGQIIPYEIYNNSCYSIITESSYDNSFSFYTEKTAKALLSSRLFVMFAGQYYLKNLRNLGYKTFSDVIDESYDEIQDHETRWREAFKQVKYLCEQSQEKILKKIIPTVTHNYRLIMSYDWIAPLRDHIEDTFIKNN